MQFCKKFGATFLMSVVVISIGASSLSSKKPAYQGRRKNPIKKIGEWHSLLSPIPEDKAITSDTTVEELIKTSHTLNNQYFPGLEAQQALSEEAIKPSDQTNEKRVENNVSSSSNMETEEAHVAAALLTLKDANRAAISAVNGSKKAHEFVSNLGSLPVSNGSQGSRFLNLPNVSPYSPLQYGWRL